MAKKRRELNNNLNLVPFIDLFSTLIIFLLATAVWEQLAVVPVQLGSSDKNQIQMPSSSADAKKVKAEIKVSIGNARIVLVDRGNRKSYTREEAIANDYELVAEFANKARETRKEDKREVVFEVSDKAQYQDLIGTMDKFLAVKFDELIVMGAR